MRSAPGAVALEVDQIAVDHVEVLRLGARPPAAGGARGALQPHRRAFGACGQLSGAAVTADRWTGCSSLAGPRPASTARRPRRTRASRVRPHGRAPARGPCPGAGRSTRPTICRYRPMCFVGRASTMQPRRAGPSPRSAPCSCVTTCTLPAERLLRISRRSSIGVLPSMCSAQTPDRGELVAEVHRVLHAGGEDDGLPPAPPADASG